MVGSVCVLFLVRGCHLSHCARRFFPAWNSRLLVGKNYVPLPLAGWRTQSLATGILQTAQELKALQLFAICTWPPLALPSQFSSVSVRAAVGWVPSAQGHEKSPEERIPPL